MNYTKGEWEIANGTFIYCLNEAGTNRFDCGLQRGWDDNGERTSRGELEANAHLIAAAPEMYEALKLMLERMESKMVGSDYGMAFELPKVWAERALAKAEGKK
jgi:hypothetical protein